MLRKMTQLNRFLIEAFDGQAGRVDDIYFHRGGWLVRYLLMRADFEPEYRRVLISTYSINALDEDRHAVSVNLTTEQLRNSPETDLSAPVSRQHEADLNRYYGWPADWLGAEHDVTPIGALSGEQEHLESSTRQEVTGADLQRAGELIETFRVQTNDAEIGKVVDFIIDDESWQIRYLAAEFADSPTGFVTLPTTAIERVDWIDGHVYADATGEMLRASPPYDPANGLSRQQQEQLRVYAGGK